MYNRILVAVDGGTASNLALKEAIKLTGEQHSLLRLVHIIDPHILYLDVETPYVVDYQKSLEAAGEKVIADSSAMAREAGIKFEGASIAIERQGQRVYDAIEEEANRWQADLIVIGTHGRRGIGRALLGSVAEGVTRIASKPVLLIRAA